MAYVFDGVDYKLRIHPNHLGVGVGVGEFDAVGTLGFLRNP